MRVMVTGGNGFIGQYVVEQLIEKGHEPFIFDRRDLRLDFDVDMFLGDVRDEDSVNEAMAHSEGWIHLAGILGTQETIINPGPAATTNIMGGLNILTAAAQYKTPGVNIAVGNHWMRNSYSITKNAVERFVEMFIIEQGLPAANVRAFNAYGPRQAVAAPFGDSKIRKIIPAFVCRALVGSKIEVYGDGLQVMDMIHANDVARILVATLDHVAEHGPVEEVIEAGSGNETTVLRTANIVADEVSTQLGLPPVPIEHLPMRPGEPEGAIVMAGAGLGMLPVLGIDWIEDLEVGIRDTVDWYHERWLPEWLSKNP
jgi:UDP-glucose 4-epimerase